MAAEIGNFTQKIRELEAELKGERERHAQEVDEIRWSAALENTELRSELASVQVRFVNDSNQKWCNESIFQCVRGLATTFLASSIQA